MCPPTRGKQPLTKGLCSTHYWQQNKMKSFEKAQAKEIEKEAGLPELIADADAVFSKWVRLSAANRVGTVTCYICLKFVRWQEAEAMHYIKRGHLYLRWDARNVKAGCNECNCLKDGNILKYGIRLEEESPGITEILLEESAIVYRPGHDELKSLILEYSDKVKRLEKVV